MRILTFSPKFIGYKAADLSAQFYDEFIELAKRVKEVIVVVGRGEGRCVKELPNLKVHEAWTVRKPHLYGFTKIMSFMLAPIRGRSQIDLIYVRTFSPPELISLWMAKRLARIPSVLTVPGTWLFEPPTLKNMVYRWVLRRALETSDVVVLYSWRMLPELKKYSPKLNEGKIRIVRNAVDLNRFTPGLECEDVRNKWGIKKGERVILYVGRVNRKKGIEEIVRAVPLVEKGIEAKFLIIGGGEKRFIDEMKSLAKELGVEKKIIFTGPVPNANIPKYCCLSDLFVYMSRGGEGIPRACLEAMACGKPVIATSIAGTSDAVREGENGFIVPPLDYRSLAERITMILKDCELLKSLGKKSRKIVEEEFSYEVVVPSLIKVFNSVLSKENCQD